MTENDITYQDKINELRLDVLHPNNERLSFILVEGESDIRLFRKFFDLRNCKVEKIPGGNSKVEDAVSELLSHYDLIIGIRDADFIHLNKITYSNKNIFLTDFHDIEMSLIYEDTVFSSIVFEYTNIEYLEHSKIRSLVLKLIQDISLLKWINEKENLEIKFEGSGFYDLISFENETLDFKQYFNRVLSKSPNAKIKDESIIESKISNLKELITEINLFQLCNGHDFIKALSKFLREQGKVVSDDSLASIFRTNYKREYFIQTSLFHKIKEWEDGMNCTVHI